MRDDCLAGYETFLVEDVILTLGNLRGSLSWLGQANAAGDPGMHRAGLARLERQIELLEDRARAVCKIIRPTPSTDLEGSSTAAYVPAVSLERLLHDALGTEPTPLHDAAGVPEFRSRRAALG